MFFDAIDKRGAQIDGKKSNSKMLEGLGKQPKVLTRCQGNGKMPK